MSKKTPQRQMTYAIDFGTSNSLLAASVDGKPVDPIPLDPMAVDQTVLRTLLFFPDPDHCYYGANAIEEFVKNDLQGRFIRSIKKFLPMRTFIGTFVDDRPLHLEDIIGIFLGEMRKRANAHFGQDVRSVVLGHPARFSLDEVDNTFALNRLARAATKAGFEDIGFFPEPLAAAFELKPTLKKAKTILVADFGGGTSDFTVINLKPDTFDPEDVLGIGGVPLAGDSYDGSLMRKKVAKHLGAEVKYKVPFGSNVLTMPTSLMEKLCSPADFGLLRKPDVMEFFKNVQQWSLGKEDKQKMDQLFTVIEDNLAFQLFEKIEAAKRALSEKDSASIDFCYPDIRPDVLFEEHVTRTEFETGAENITARILRSLDETLAQAQLPANKIDLVYCTGGTARLPVLRNALIERFGSERMQSQNFFHSIVKGLAVRAGDMSE